MRVSEMADKFGMTVLAGLKGVDRDVVSGHCSDLLSEVIGNAPPGSVWLTVQGHQNIIAVAILRDIAAVIVTGGNMPDRETLRKADLEDVALLKWSGSSYELAGKLFAEGIRSAEV